MSKILLIMGVMLLGSSYSWAQDRESTINKCDNSKDPIVYTEFDCPEGYEVVTEGWLSETNITSGAAFGDETNTNNTDTYNNNSYQQETPLE